MKRIQLLTKSLLFLSFFLPFVLLPTCNHKAEIEMARIDSLKKDSIFRDSLAQIGKLDIYLDSIKRMTDSVKLKAHETASISKDSFTISTDTLKPSLTQKNDELKETKIGSLLATIGNLAINPTYDSLSGFAMVLVLSGAPFCKLDNFELRSLLALILPIGYLIIIYTLVALFFKPKLKSNSF